MKINFIYESFPTTWIVKYGNNREQLKENILKYKKVYITALYGFVILYFFILFKTLIVKYY